MARNKYTYYASVAKKAGYEQVKAFLKKQQITKKNTLKFGSNCSKAACRKSMMP